MEQAQKIIAIHRTSLHVQCAIVVGSVLGAALTGPHELTPLLVAVAVAVGWVVAFKIPQITAVKLWSEVTKQRK